MQELEINDELIVSIVRFLKDRGYSSRTFKEYRANLKRLLDSNKILNQQVCLKYLRKNRHPNQRIVVKILNEYCQQKGIDFSVTIPRVRPKPRAIPDILSIDEIKVMVKSAPHPYDLMIRCIFGIGSGLRISEAIRLTWNSIRWVEWINNKEYGVAVLRDTKRGTDRVVNIPNELMEDLYAIAKQRNLLNEHGIPVGQLIFPMHSDRYKLELQSIDIDKWKAEYISSAYNWFRYNILQKHCEPALNKKIRAHMLRHSRATYLYEVEKLPIERVQQLLGHKDIHTTMIYTRIDPKSTFEMIKGTKIV